MNSEQIKDMHLLYNAVYNEELREQFDEYNNTIYDEDIVEVATEYFYSYGLNEDGIGILIEKVGLESFVEYVYDLSEDLHVLTEARARKKYSGPSYDEVKAGIDAREAKARAKKEAKKKASEAASEKKETERAEPESRGVESQAKAEQPKSKKPERSGIARAISGAVDRAKRDTELLKKSWNTAREVGRGHEANVARAAGTVAGAAHGAAKVAHRLGQEAGKSETGKKIKKVLFGEEVEAWVNSLIEEGYDLSEYTWDEMTEIYLDEANRGDEHVTKNIKNPSEKRIKKQQRRNWDFTGRSTHEVDDEQSTKDNFSANRRELTRTLLTPDRKSSDGSTIQPSRSTKLSLMRQRLTRERRGKSGGGLRESYDIYDIILSHLIEEGYAESVEQAEVIMVNMSEDWRESIVEAAADQSDKQIEKGVKTTYRAKGVLANQASRGLNRLPSNEREGKKERMNKRLETRRDDLFGERNRREDESRAEFKKKYGL
jgi:hypothetical protein